MFTSISRSLGTIQQKSKHTIVYPYVNIERIVSMQAPCDCTDFTNDVAGQYIKVTYSVPEIPAHLIARGQNSMETIKSITVIFVSKDAPDVEQTTILSFNGIIV
jgi:hypothetical protein